MHSTHRITFSETKMIVKYLKNTRKSYTIVKKSLQTHEEKFMKPESHNKSLHFHDVIHIITPFRLWGRRTKLDNRGWNLLVI